MAATGMGSPRASCEEKMKPKLKSILVIPNQGMSPRAFPVSSRPPIASRLTFPPSYSAVASTRFEGDGWERAKSRSQRRREAKLLQATQRSSVFQHLGNSIHPKHPSFRESAVGCCFHCLATNHKAFQCRDPVRCISCFRSGHRAS
jgi:hypothetical protein